MLAQHPVVLADKSDAPVKLTDFTILFIICLTTFFISSVIFFATAHRWRPKDNPPPKGKVHAAVGLNMIIWFIIFFGLALTVEKSLGSFFLWRSFGVIIGLPVCSVIHKGIFNISFAKGLILSLIPIASIFAFNILALVIRLTMYPSDFP